jgi:N-acetylglucosaminyl-diphospho-decaprenol L-rhamnosyltransferase
LCRISKNSYFVKINRNSLKISIIIVNYNVKFFLEQCLCSVRKAIEKLDQKNAEVFVVDNHSSDGSLEYLEGRFPWVRFIPNQENLGFAKANNLALGKSIGDYILFLNPDTIMAEDCLKKITGAMDGLSDAGACTIRLVDGRGRYLEESKRGFPSPWFSLCKLSGLTALFPHSALFARYYLGHLDPGKINRIDTLPGAFLMLKRSAIEKTGGFDERFFMYGEDIDLSYRIRLAGFNNYYLPISSLIHFKGESTRKDLRQLRYFYSAMIRFSRKYFRSGAWFFLGPLLELGIWVRAGLSALVLPLRSKNSGLPECRGPVCLLGDEQTVAGARSFLLSGQTLLVDSSKDAEEIIFCEGPGFSFSEIIRHIQEAPPGKGYKFHAAGSRSIVGSASKNRKGGFIFIPDFFIFP